VIIVEGLIDQHALSLSLDTLSNITLHKNSGTISCIGHKTNKRGDMVQGSLFRLIVDAPHVYELLREAQAGLLTPIEHLSIE